MSPKETAMTIKLGSSKGNGLLFQQNSEWEKRGTFTQYESMLYTNIITFHSDQLHRFTLMESFCICEPILGQSCVDLSC